jgi:hypothetical protein
LNEGALGKPFLEGGVTDTDLVFAKPDARGKLPVALPTIDMLGCDVDQLADLLDRENPKFIEVVIVIGHGFSIALNAHSWWMVMKGRNAREMAPCHCHNSN